MFVFIADVDSFSWKNVRTELNLDFGIFATVSSLNSHLQLPSADNCSPGKKTTKLHSCHCNPKITFYQSVDDKLSWVPHMLDLKMTLAKKLDLIRRSRFLPKDVLINFYFKVIFQSVTYGLVLWGWCLNADLFAI